MSRPPQTVVDWLARLWRKSPPVSAFARLEAESHAILRRFEQDALMPGDVIAPGDLHDDGALAWVRGMLDKRALHDADYVVFRHFSPAQGTILDVGANWGYSVGSIRAVDCACPILSIEVIESYRACLAEIRQSLGRDYDFIISGVGARRDRLRFRTPVVNGVAVTALCSAEKSTDLAQYIVENIVHHTKVNIPLSAAGRYAVKLWVVDAVVDTLDQLLLDYAGPVPVDRIAAIKIDVEGLEDAALAGGVRTILASRPFLLIEGGDRPAGVKQKLMEFGYLTAERDGDQLVPTEHESREVNGLFYHPSRVDEYRALGLLRG